LKHKLLAYYKHSLEQAVPPSPSQLSDYYWFKVDFQDDWIGIQKQEIDDSQLELLKACYDFFQPDETLKKEEYSWNQYLYFNGEQPSFKNMETLRFIQFHIKGDTTSIERKLIESAFDGFIHENSLIIWNGSNEGVVIEQNAQYLEEEDFTALAQALQSDFFFSICFYMGKELKLNSSIPVIFGQERNFFSKGLAFMPKSTVLSLETILPNLLISRLKEDELDLFKEWFSIFEEDKELLLTIKTFIENNGHSTNTAKQLFIHRNTLQYRLDKFTEKTGLNLKNYHSYITTYLACLFYTSGK
jgi:PucR C-terminal helix-turn-helix domain